MKRWWIQKAIKMVALFLLTGTLMSFLLMTLWNWLMPAIFNLGMINFWQALGVLVLTKLLFGFGRGGWIHAGKYYGGSNGKEKGGYWKQKMEEKLKNMTPEEREKFRTEWRKRCGWRYTHNPEENEKEDSGEVTK
ncbi:MAG: hypothetical protein H0W62_10145 [Chitinophagales bacterium]|nr:hypothetical protein [Chitinophagales bacterium]